MGKPGVFRRLVGEWLDILYGPMIRRYRQCGIVALPKVALAVSALSLAATASMRLPGVRPAAAMVLVYRGHDLYVGAVWRLPASALLAQSWWQWTATAAIAGLALVPLEARMNASILAGCLLVAHCVPTVVVAGLARLTDVSELNRPDYGTSCLMIGSVAALAWQTQSRLIALALVTSLVLDPLFNSPVTIAEHLMAALLGALLSALVGAAQRTGERRHHGFLAPVTVVDTANGL